MSYIYNNHRFLELAEFMSEFHTISIEHTALSAHELLMSVIMSAIAGG